MSGLSVASQIARETDVAPSDIMAVHNTRMRDRDAPMVGATPGSKTSSLHTGKPHKLEGLKNFFLKTVPDVVGGAKGIWNTMEVMGETLLPLVLVPKPDRENVIPHDSISDSMNMVNRQC